MQPLSPSSRTGTILEYHFRVPENASLQDIEADLQEIFLLMECPMIPSTLLTINMFMRYLAHRLPAEKQVELFVRAAIYYSFLKENGTVAFESIWLLAKAKGICENNRIDSAAVQNVESTLNRYEEALRNHPFISAQLISNLSQSFGAVYVSLQESSQKLKEKYDTCLSQIQAKKPLTQVILYNQLRSELTDPLVNSSYVNYSERSRLAGTVQTRINQAKMEANTPYKWSHFRVEYQFIKRETTNSSDFSTKMREFIRRVLSYCHESLSDLAPCAYVVLDKGSFVRKEATSKSDVDWAFLIEDETKREPFIKNFLPIYLAMVRFYLGCLDDLWMVDSLNEKDPTYPLVRYGLDMDEGDLEHLIGKEFLLTTEKKAINLSEIFQVNTPQNMFKWITEDFYTGNFEPELLAYPRSLFFAQPLFASSGNRLFADFRELLQPWWSDAVRRKNTYRHFLQYHLDQFPNRMKIKGQEHEQIPFIRDLKQGWMHPIMLWSFDLAFHLGLSGSITVESIFDVLCDCRCLLESGYFFMRFRHAWQQLLDLRWQKQREQECAPDVGAPNEVLIRQNSQLEYSPSHRFRWPVLSLQQLEMLNEIDKFILVPAYALLKKLHQTGQLLDPLLALCQLEMAEINVQGSLSSTLQNILSLLRQKRIDPFELPDEESLHYPSRPCPESLKLWLLSDYKDKSQQDKVYWLQQLLKIDALFYWIDPEAVQQLIKEIIYHPASDGWRLAQDLEYMQFCLDIKKVVIKDPEVGDSLPTKITLLDLDDPFSFHTKEYHLTKNARNQLLQDNGKFKKLDEEEVPSQHTSLPVREGSKILFWVKPCPENFSRDDLAWQIAWRLGKGGIPPSMIAKLEAGGRNIAVLLPQHVEGKRMALAREEIDKISRRSYSQSLLRVLATSPEDDKPEDYFLVEKNGEFILKRIDNDRLFCKATERGWIYHTPRVKSVLFFHKLMLEPQDDETITTFVSTRTADIFRSLVLRLQVLHQIVRQLFSKNEVKEHFYPAAKGNEWNVRVTQTCLLPIYINKYSLGRLSTQLYLLHRKCQEQPHVTGIDLLQTLHPTLNSLLQKGWHNPLPGRLHPTLERLDSLKLFEQDRRSSYRTSRSQPLNLISKSHGVKTLSQNDALAAYDNESNSPKQALDLLEQLDNRDLSKVIDMLKRSKPAFVTLFCNLFAHQQNRLLESFKAEHNLDLDQLRLILQALAQSSAKILSLDLRFFSRALNDDLLKGILEKRGKKIFSLNLAGCDQITDASIGMINKYCIRLKQLVLDRCPKLGPLLDLASPTLEVLSFEECEGVKALRLNAPCLEELYVRLAKNLTTMELNTLYLKVFRCDKQHYIKIPDLFVKWFSSPDLYIYQERTFHFLTITLDCWGIGLPLLEQLASEGHVGAMFRLGVWYRSELELKQYESPSVEETFQSKCLEWYRRAAASGHVEAMLHIGQMYASRLILTISNVEALQMLNQAANKGDSESMFLLGRLYMVDQGNKRAGLECYEHAAIRGHRGAMFALCEYYMGLENGHQLGMKWYMMAAEQGHILAYQWFLHNTTWIGSNITKSFLDMLERNSQKVDAEVMYQLGQYFLRDAKDVDRCIFWWEQAAKKAHKQSYNDLMKLFFALEIPKCIIDKNHLRSEDQKYVQRVSRALTWFEENADLVRPDSMFAIGTMHRYYLRYIFLHLRRFHSFDKKNYWVKVYNDEFGLMIYWYKRAAQFDHWEAHQELHKICGDNVFDSKRDIVDILVAKFDPWQVINEKGTLLHWSWEPQTIDVKEFRQRFPDLPQANFLNPETQRC